MTLRDNITHGRAKGLWTGKSMNSAAVPLGRMADYGRVSEMHVLLLAGCGGCAWDAATYKVVPEPGMRTSRLSCGGRSKVVADGQFEAVLGKTRRTEF